jgi:hypothetical protein
MAENIFSQKGSVDHMFSDLQKNVNTLFQRWNGVSKANQKQLDLLFKTIHKRQAPTFADARAYARLVILGSLARIELHLAAIVILLLSLGTGIFIPLTQADWTLRLNLIGTAMILGTGLSFALVYVFLCLHIWKGLGLWAIAVLHATSCAVLFCLLEPSLVAAYHTYTTPRFEDIFFPLLMFYALADVFILWQIEPLISFERYKRTNPKDHLATAIPARKRGEIFLMSAADHYVEIFTERGSHLHRITMKAAIEKTKKSAGMRVHRSHWVAYSAMVSLEKVGERHFLTLRSGHRVPVSPTYIDAVKQTLAPMNLAAE